MSFLDTLKHLVEHGQVFATDTEKAAHLAELEAARELESVLPRLQAVEKRLAALELSQPAHAPAPRQDPEGPTTPPTPITPAENPSTVTGTDTPPSVQS